MPRPSGGGVRADGEDDAQAEADSKPAKDARLPGTRGVLRLPGLHVGPMLSCENRESIHRHATLEERVLRLFGTISKMTRHQTRGRETEEVVGELNLVLKGWANYFRLGSVSKAYRAVDRHTRNRLRRWLCRKHKVKGSGTRRYPVAYLHETLGLLRLTRFHTTLPWAKAS